jgi:prepilin-type N-terminal cleavage/methylation domain-containing protein
MRRNGFTLIELLVVVAIIGILAAVGTVAYNGYTQSAKVNAVKTQHKMMIKSVNAELMKCELGAEKIMAEQQWCSNAHKTQYICNNITEYNRHGLKLKNPYPGAYQSDQFQCRGNVPSSDRDLGKITYNNMGGPGSLRVIICLKTRCNDPSNRFTEMVKVNNQF